MQKGEKEEKAINPQPYTPYPYTSSVSEREISVEEVEKNRIEWRNLADERQEEDLLAFMETFDFPPLEDLRQSLTDSGEYKPEQVEEIISGLKTLPEYRD